MRIEVADPHSQTLLFSAIFLLMLILSLRPSAKGQLFPPSTTDELKGVALLAVIFSHIGYFLSANTQFLFPWSSIAGVAVNLFLFLSGFGLATSAFQHKLSLGKYFKKRVVRLFVPLWIVIVVFLLADYLLLQRTYPIDLTIQNFLGLYPHADLYQDINSPLWFITLIIFYYLIFPFFFWRSRPYWSVLAILLLGSLILKYPGLPIHVDTLKLYHLHFAAFPLGILFASLVSGRGRLGRQIERFYSHQINSRPVLKEVLRVFALLAVMALFSYTAINSAIGQELDKEHLISLVTMISAVFIFLLKNVRFNLLKLFGVFSYEIYLFHWPILYRYDVFYKQLPPFLATLLYLGLFLLLGFLLQNLSELISQRVTKGFTRTPSKD